MRILVLNHNLRERGTWFRARAIAKGLHARGHDVTFVCTGEGYYRTRRPATTEPRWEEWESANWTPLRESGDGWSPLGMLQRICLLWNRWDFVYTFSHKPVDQGTARFLGRKTGFWMTDWCDLWNSRAGGLHDMRHWSRPVPRRAGGVHGALLRASFRLEDQLERNAVMEADAVSFIAKPMRRYIRRLGISDKRILHLVSGADLEHITPRDREECRRILGLPEEGLIVGYAANISPDNVLLENALQVFWRRFPKARLLTIGPPWATPGGPVELASRRGLVIDHDRQPHERVPLYLGASDFLVLPLRNLAFNRCRWPNKLCDYLASGRAVAVNDVGDMGGAIERLGAGAVGSPTAEGLAEAMCRLADDTVLRKEAGSAARQAAVTEFGWESVMTRLVEFLHKQGLAV